MLFSKHLNHSFWMVYKKGVLLSVFAQQMHRKSSEDTDIHFTLIDAVGMSPSLVVLQNAKTKRKTKSRVLFRKKPK